MGSTLAGTNAGALVGTHKMDNTVTNMAVDTERSMTLEEVPQDGKF